MTFFVMFKKRAGVFYRVFDMIKHVVHGPSNFSYHSGGGGGGRRPSYIKLKLIMCRFQKYMMGML